MKKQILYTACLLLLCLSCREEEIGKQGIPAGKPIAAKFTLASGSMEEVILSGSTSTDDLEVAPNTDTTTRASAEEGLIILESTINNVTVAQFNGTTDEAILVGTPTYVDTYDAEAFEATLSVSEDEHTIVFIANTGDIKSKITTGMTLAALKALTHNIPDQLVLDVNGYLPMVGTWTGPISMESLNANNQIIKVPMERVMAKFILNVDNAVSGLQIDEVRISNVPTSVCLFTPKELSGTTTYKVPTFTADDKRYIWFMPENMSDTQNTQVEIYASKDEQKYIYTTHLNVNNGDDYKVRRNTQHHLTVTIKRLTDAVTEMDLTFDCHGEVYALNLKDVATEHVPGFDNASNTFRGYTFALNTWAQNDANSYSTPTDKCVWIQLHTKNIFSSSWLTLDSYGNPPQYATGMPTTGATRLLYVFINENLSLESRYAKVRLRYDAIMVSGAQTTKNIILNVEQEGYEIVGPFGGYDTGTYTKQLAMETIEDDSAMSWAMAKNVCAEKFYDPANKHWYLPSQVQLTAIWIANYDSRNALKDSYWSATDNGGDAWGVDMSTGIMRSESQSASKKVRCVRDLDTTNI